MRSQIETIDGTTKTTEDITYSADENISGQTTTIQNLEIENEQNIFAKIKQKFTKVSTEQNFADYINSETNGGNISETIKFYNDHGLCKCDLTTYKPFIEDRDFTTQYQMPGIAYLQQSPNHSWNMSLVEYKTEQPLSENNVENYLTSPPIDNTTYPSINHISSNINGKSNNQTIVYGNELLFSESISETTNYILNGQNNVIHEQINNKIINYQYDAYGQQLTNSPTPTFGYNAEYQINDSTQYLRARTYDNTTGRMMQYDTYQGSLNPLSRNHYTYAHNNPVNLEDPSGNSVAAAVFLTVKVIKWTKRIIHAANSVHKVNKTKTATQQTRSFTANAKHFVSEVSKQVKHEIDISWKGALITLSQSAVIEFSINGTRKIISNVSYKYGCGFLKQMIDLMEDNKAWWNHELTIIGLANEVYTNTIDIITADYKDIKKQCQCKGSLYDQGKMFAFSFYRDMKSAVLQEKWNIEKIGDGSKGPVPGSSSSAGIPSTKIEEYWVPVYVSHGNNQTVYK